jgi:arginyl-tRNA synthetase
VTPAELSSAILAAVRDAVADGELAVPVPGRAETRTTPAGEQVSPIALQLTKQAGRPAGEIAELIAKRLDGRPGITDVRVTGPGFLTVAMETTLPTPVNIPYADPQKATWPDRPRTFANPGFRVRFAYARAAAARRHARELGIDAARGPLTDPRERRVAGLVGEFPHHARLTRYLVVLADAYHDVYEQCPVLPKGDEAITAHHGRRLSLAEAVHTVVGNGLRMLGESPRERI